jgi:hypothetical protein
MSYIRLLCLFAYGGVQHLFCFVFALFFLVLYVTVSVTPTKEHWLLTISQHTIRGEKFRLLQEKKRL